MEKKIEIAYSKLLQCPKAIKTAYGSFSKVYRLNHNDLSYLSGLSQDKLKKIITYKDIFCKVPIDSESGLYNEEILLPSGLNKTDDFNHLKNQKSTEFVFPEVILTIKNQPIATLSEFIEGKQLEETAYTASFKRLEDNINGISKKAVSLAKNKIIINDLYLTNIIDTGKKLRIIDTDEYQYIKEADENYCNQHNQRAISQLLIMIVRKSLNIDFLSSQTTKKITEKEKMLLNGTISNIEYLKDLKQKIEEITKSDINSFKSAKKKLVKHQ